MKILVMSDTHGKERNLRKVIEREGMPDMAIHLGDHEGGEDRIRGMLSACPVYMVAGNCDYFCDLPSAAVVKIPEHRIMITHGHGYFVSAGTRELAETARKSNCDLAMFGHTHKPYLDQKEDGLIILNPGSLSNPRQDGRKPSYAIVNVEEGKTYEIEIRYL